MISARVPITCFSPQLVVPGTGCVCRGFSQSDLAAPQGLRESAGSSGLHLEPNFTTAILLPFRWPSQGTGPAYLKKTLRVSHRGESSEHRKGWNNVSQGHDVQARRHQL